MNAINVIAPYKWVGMWVFDDPRGGLEKEPFVAGADTMIEMIAADIHDAANGFVLVFSGTPFPGHQFRFDFQRADNDGGNWYRSEEYKIEGLQEVVWVFWATSEGWKHACEHLEPQIFLVA